MTDRAGAAGPRSVCLDLSRSVARFGQGPATGIDRVERAYLDHFLSIADLPLHGLIRLRAGHALLDRPALQQLRAALAMPDAGKPARLWPLLAPRFVPRPLLARHLARRLAPGLRYLNVGHTGIGPRVLSGLRAIPGARIAVMLHDAIPLTHPHLTRPGTPERFAGLLSSVANEADLILFNSRQTATEVAAVLPPHRTGQRHLVAPLGVQRFGPAPAALPYGLDPRRPVFTCVGTIEPRKNHDLLLEIWERLERSRTPAGVPQLAVVGRRGWAGADLFRRLDHATATGRSVHAFNAMTDRDLAGLLAASSGLLFPSLAEGFGLPAAEAAAMSVPVICSDLPVFREILGDHPTYCDPTDPDAWQRAITERADAWLADPTARPDPLPVPTWDNHFNIVLNHLW